MKKSIVDIVGNYETVIEIGQFVVIKFKGYYAMFVDHEGTGDYDHVETNEDLYTLLKECNDLLNN